MAFGWYRALCLSERFVSRNPLLLIHETVSTIRKNEKEEYIFNSERLGFRKWRNEDFIEKQK